MVQETITVWEKPFSINATYYATKAVKTPAARAWTYKIFDQLDTAENLEAMARLHEAFDPKEHYFSVDMLIYYPKEKLINKAGEVSGRSLDLSNVEKNIIDILFLKKHWDKPAPFGSLNIGHDDKFIGELRSRKVFWERPEHKMVFTISIESISDLDHSESA